MFKVTLPCSGELDAEVDVKIFLNVSIFSALNVTTLELRRRKNCRLGKPGPGQKQRSNSISGNSIYIAPLQTVADQFIEFGGLFKLSLQSSKGGCLDLHYLLLVAFVAAEHFGRR